MSLIRLVYASESRLVDAHRQEELCRILTSARRLNHSNGVTGFLLVTDTAFAQVLEGPRDTVAETYGRIGADPRHTKLRLIAEEPAAARTFPEWAMGVAEQDETTAFIFGLYGISPGQDLDAQPLDVLLDLAGEFAR